MISVVMPAYNAADFIGEAIQSILDQTYTDYEFIIVDDGSTDGTAAIIQSYAERDPRIRLIENPHGGVCEARNTAIRQASGDWIVLMDADDIARPHRIERLVQAAEADPEVVVWGSYLTRITINGDVIGNIEVGTTSKEAFYAIDRTQRLIEMFAPTAMFRRDIALKVGGYNPLLLVAEDSELWDRMADYGPIVTIPESLLLYRLHDKSLTMTNQDMITMLHGFPPARQRARAEGRDLTVEQYIEDYHNRPLRQRLATYMLNRSKYYGKMASIVWARRQYPLAGVYLALSIAVQPRFMLTRIWNDFIFKKKPGTAT